MKTFVLLVLFYNLVVAAFSREICYGDLGCFTDSYPFSSTIQRPLALLPDSPEKISTLFYLFNRKSPTNRILINSSNIVSNYDASLKTKFIIHGFLDNTRKQWMIDMKGAMLDTDNVNVILVDWSKGNGFPYTQATANTQVVGAEIAKLINSMITKKNANIDSFHLIGHSLGSHICGYAGFRLNGKIPRITGLDPAGPYFENTDPIVRLDPSDAKFVEAIHSDGTANLQLGLGLFQPIGHVDFYPNGGKDQPSCSTTSGKLLGAIFNLIIMDIQAIEDSVACSHFGAIHFFTDSMKNKKCKYTSYPCASKTDFDNGDCLKCSSKGCNRLGYFASNSTDTGSLYLNTQPTTGTQLCQQFFQFNLYSNTINNIIQTRGRFTVFLRSSKETSETIVLDDSQLTYKQDSVNSRFVSLNSPIDTDSEIESLFVSFTKTTNVFSGWLYDSKWSFKYIELFNGDKQTMRKYCPQELIIDSGKTVEFKKC